MKVLPVKTNIVKKSDDLFALLDKYVPSLKEKSILAITSKIVSICENNVIPINAAEKERLIQTEADFYLPSTHKYKINITIKNHILIPSAGIDESNGNGYYVLWPKNARKTANQIRRHLRKGFGLKELGIIITDSKTTPLRSGTTGVGIAFSGFKPLSDYIGKSDIFGEKLRVTKANLLDALATAGVLLMGEGNEQTPLAIIEDIPFIEFISRNPSKAEIAALFMNPKEDLYSEMLKSVEWKKGTKQKSTRKSG